MISSFKMLSSPRKLSKGGFRIDPSQFPRYSMYKHTTVQKLNGSKKVTVGVWASTTQTPHTPGFIPNFHWYRTTDKSSYSNRNSAKQVPQIEGLPEPEQQLQQSQLQLGDVQ